MGMTTEEAKEHLSQYIGDNRVDYDDLDAIEVAVDLIQKYQKIEQIVKVWHQDIYAKDFECMAEIAEVVEDGNDDT